MNAGFEREAARQQQLLQALWGHPRDPRDGRATAASTAPDASDPTLQAASLAGLQVYRGNAAAHAEHALAAMHPTVAALVGAEGLAALARGLWQQHPPERGDLGEWGHALPAFIAAQATLAPEPYLADSAHLDGLVHQASRAPDSAGAGSALGTALGRLAEHSPQALRLVLSPGCGLLRSAWPVASIWHAHQPAALQAADRFDAVRAALATAQGETAFVWRDGLRVCVEAVGPATADFTAALLGRADLAAALDAAGPDFSFEHWLQHAVQSASLVDIALLSADPTLPTEPLTGATP